MLYQLKSCEEGHGIDGGPDIGYGATQGDTIDEALAQGEDLLEEAVLGMIAHKEEVPAPSPAKGRPVSKQVTHLFDGYHAIRIEQLEAALAALGRRLVVTSEARPTARGASP